jgi:hypothetical protein
MNQDLRKNRSGHETHRAALLAVAREIGNRGYEVSSTRGNTAPETDLIVTSPKLARFQVDVKGLCKVNPWQVKRKPRREDLFYVLAYVPTDGNNRFFVMTQNLVNQAVHDRLTRLNRPDNYSRAGFNFDVALPYEDKWSLLPA